MSKSEDPKIRAYDRTLFRIERTGQYLLTVTVVAFISLGAVWPEPYANVWQLVLAHIVGGRALNVLRGLDLGFHPLFIFIQCGLEDIIILLLFYPFLVAGYRKAVEWRVLGPTLVSIREAADRHKSKIEPYGAVGLMVFVIFPFWSTGALVAAVVGYLIRMRTWVVFTSVLTGNFVAVALWVWFFDRINEWSGHLTRGLLIAVFTLVVCGAVIAQIRSLVATRRAYEIPTPEERSEEKSETESAAAEPNKPSSLSKSHTEAR